MLPADGDESQAARGLFRPVPPRRTHHQRIAKVVYMSDLHDQEQILRVSGDGKEFVVIELESASPVTVRLQLDGGCNCQHVAGNRPGSYVDSDLVLR